MYEAYRNSVHKLINSGLQTFA